MVDRGVEPDRGRQLATNLESLERLAKLRESGALSVTEFELEKKKLLGPEPQKRTTGWVVPLVSGFAILAVGAIGWAIGGREATGPPSRHTARPNSPAVLPKAPATSPTSTASPQSAASAPPSQASPMLSPWAGTYKGKFEGDARGVLKISEGAEGRLKFSLGIAAEGCAGGLEATLAVLSGTEGVVALSEDDSGNACRISMVRRGSTIRLTEEGCGYHHGFECSFSGMVKR